MTRLEHALEDLKEFQKAYPHREVFPFCVEALENQEILLETQRILLELLNKVDCTNEVCFELDGDWCAEHCQNNKTGECYLEYCKIKREEKNDN